MKRLLILIVVVLVATAAYAEKFKKADKHIPNQYIVVFDDAVSEDDVVALSTELTYKHGGLKDRVYTKALKGFAVNMSEGQAKKLADDERVAWVEEDGEVNIDTTQTGATWGLDRIDQRDRPLNSTFVYFRTGAGVKAYIIDTGIRTSHTQFGGRAIDGTDRVDGTLPAADCNGHGTHVAGTVGGSTYGVAKGVTLVAVRVLNCSGSGSWSGIIAGIDWVRGNHPAGAPAVANMSLGGGASSSVDAAVNSCISDGVTFAIAAGNSNANACNSSPARVAAAITVGSTTSSDARSSFSNYGSCLDIFAPGSSITSAWSTSNTAINTISGTSMAAPHVAGVAVLYLAGNTSASPSTVRNALVNNSSLNKVSNAGSGSPNRLLFTNY